MTDTRLEGLKAFVSRDLGHSCRRFEALGGDASLRRYFRTDGFIAVDSPPSSQKNAEFLRIAQALSLKGVRVPKILSSDLENGYLLEEDLGNLMFSDVINGEQRSQWYQRALKLLPDIASVETPLPAFDKDFIAFEFSIFTEWLLDKSLHLVLNKAEKQMLNHTLSVLSQACLSQPQVAMHRDFHSRNLMVCGDELVVIDFQDMVKGPLTYDAASLIFDCYIRLPDDLVVFLIQKAYENLQSLCKEYSQSEFKRLLLLVSLQRHLKVLGIFNRLNLRDGKPSYLKDLPRVLAYALDESMACGLYDLHDFLDAKVKGALPCAR